MSKGKRHNRRESQERALPVPAKDRLPVGTQDAQALTIDAFSNPMARVGFGTTSPLEATEYPLTRMTHDYTTLRSLYRSNWIARRVIDTPAEDMLKNGWRITSQLEPDMIEHFERSQRRTQLKARLMEGLRWGRLFGGAAAVMMIAGHERILDQPLELDQVMVGSFKGLLVADRWSGIYPGIELVGDISDPDYGLPAYYEVLDYANHVVAFRIHHSRVLRFIGRELPFWERQAEMYWGASELEAVYPEIVKWDNTSFNMANLVFQANIRDLAIPGLTAKLNSANAQAQQDLYNTLAAQSQMMSNFSLFTHEPESSMTTHQYSFSGLADVQVQFMYAVAGAAEMPVTKVFGRSASGMDATGEMDMQQYYDSIAQKQETYLRPALDKVLPVLAMSEWGAVPDDLNSEFEPVQETSEKERADLATSVTNSVLAAFNAGIGGPDAEWLAMTELREASKATGLFSNITDQMRDAAKGRSMPTGEAMPDLGMLGEPTQATLAGGDHAAMPSAVAATGETERAS